MCVYLANCIQIKLFLHQWSTNKRNLADLSAGMCLLARSYTVLIHWYFLEPSMCHSSYTTWLQGLLTAFLKNF